MPVDASIYGGIQQAQPVNRLAQLAQAAQIQGLQGQQQIAQYALKKAEREDAEITGINDAYRGATGADGTIDRNKLYSTIASGGYGSKLPGIQKQYNDADQASATLSKTKGENLKIYLDAGKQVATQVFAQPTLENAMGALDVMERHAKTLGLDGSQIAAQRQQVQGFTSPDQIKQWAAGQAMQADKLLPKIEMRNTGGTTDTLAVDPLTGKPTVTGSVTNTQSPDNKASVGASYANASATREVAKATRDAAQIKGNQDTEMKLGDDYRAQSKNFKETADAYKQITSVLDKATTSPAATLAGATKFMKMIDPGSVVRESELGMALAATGVFDRATNYFNTLANGKVLTPSQVKDFKDITKQINDAASQQQKLIDGHFSSVAKQYGLRPEMVVQDYGQNAAPGGVPPDIAAILATHGGKK